MSILKDALESGKFGVTAEMAPPKGYDFTEQMEAAELLKGKVHGVNVTDMQSASLQATGEVEKMTQRREDKGHGDFAYPRTISLRGKK